MCQWVGPSRCVRLMESIISCVPCWNETLQHCIAWDPTCLRNQHDCFMAQKDVVKRTGRVHISAHTDKGYRVSGNGVANCEDTFRAPAVAEVLGSFPFSQRVGFLPADLWVIFDVCIKYLSESEMLKIKQTNSLVRSKIWFITKKKKKRKTKKCAKMLTYHCYVSVFLHTL